MLMTYYVQRESTRREFVLKALLQSTEDSTGNENKRALLSEILGVPKEGANLHDSKVAIDDV